MPWPLSQDYNEAIQSPGSAFADPELRGGQAATNPLGIPMPCSGNFADVYQVNCPASRRSWAVKCFTRQIPGLRERYQQISLYLKQVNLPFMVDFTFLDKGMRVRGDWYPILKMEWVEGLQLNEFVKDYLHKPRAQEKLCQIWVSLARRLREANIGHCDLQHGNVLLVSGSKARSLSVKLVDYDGMCVPALTLLKSLEVGHPNFQHPQRLLEGTFGVAVDRFSHLVIYTALRALKVGGKSLWEKYDNGDNLLFKQADFEAPARSPLFAELLRMKDQEVHHLAGALIDAVRNPLDQVPLLESLVPNASGSQSIPTAQPSGQAKTTQGESPESIFGQATASPVQVGTPVERPGKRRVASFVSIALAGALVVLGVVVGVIVLAANHGTDDSKGSVSKKGPPLARNDTGSIGKPKSTHSSGSAAAPLEDAGQNGEREIENSIHMKLLQIPAGRFQMGSPPEEKDRSGNEGPRHTVEITRPFYMGAYTVTQEEYHKVMGTNPSYLSSTGEGKDKVTGLDTKRFPVEQVSWGEAVAFCNELSRLEREKKAGRMYRLPTEAEWEYACRAGTSTPFNFGSELNGKQANCNGTVPYGTDGKGPYLVRTTTVGSYPKNAFGLFDMHGNVYQWCSDWHDEEYFKRSPEKDPQGPEKGPYGERSFRGGTWNQPAWNCRAACRGRYGPDSRGGHLGFRVVCVIRDPKNPVGEIRRFVGHTAGVVDVAFSPDGRTAVSGAADKTVRLWDLESGKQIRRLDGHADMVMCVRFTPDGHNVVSGSLDKTLRLWEVATGKELRRFEHPGVVGYGMTVTPDGKRIISWGHGELVHIWDLESGKELRHFRFQGTGITDFSKDGRRALSSGGDNSLRLWDVDNGKKVRDLNGQNPGVFPGGTLSADGRFVLACGSDNYLRLYEVDSGKLIRRFQEEPGGFHGASFSPDGQRVLTPCERQDHAWLWDVQTGKKIYKIAGNPGGIPTIRFSPDGRRALSSGRDASVRLWGLPD